MTWIMIGPLLFVLLVTLVGLAYMKLRPIDDRTDESQRSTRALARQTRAVSTALLDQSNAPQTAYALRQATGLSRDTLRAIILDMRQRGLLEQILIQFAVDVDVVRAAHYRLTDAGVAAALLPGGDRASGRHRA